MNTIHLQTIIKEYGSKLQLHIICQESWFSIINKNGKTNLIYFSIHLSLKRNKPWQKVDENKNTLSKSCFAVDNVDDNRLQFS